MFCVILGVGTADIHEKSHKAFVTVSVPCAQVFQWHREFVKGLEKLKDETLFGDPASVEQAQMVTV
jgi:hypothetical protein